MEDIWTESPHLELYRMPCFHNIQTIRKSPKIISLRSICDIIKGHIIDGTASRLVCSIIILDTSDPGDAAQQVMA
jgi:hypothetical protein